jgi:phage-related minor tail protein
MSEIMVQLGLDMKDFNQKLDKAGQQMKNFGQSMQDVGSSMTSAITVPMTAIGVGAMKVASDFQSSQGKLQASLGLTESQAKNMNGTVKALWKEGFGESVDEVALGITKVSNNMKGLKGDELKQATQNAFILGKTFDADINESTRSAGQLMKDFGVDSTQAFDMLTWGFQNGLDSRASS